MGLIQILICRFQTIEAKLVETEERLEGKVVGLLGSSARAAEGELRTSIAELKALAAGKLIATCISIFPARVADPYQAR